MLFRIIQKPEIFDLVAGFAKEYEVIGPVEEGGRFFFRDISTDCSRLAIDYDVTELPPREYLLPPRQVLFEYDTAQNSVTDVPDDSRRRVLFGVHPCDINGIEILDRVFLESRFNDPYYRSQRSQTLIVGVSCIPHDQCACYLWGTNDVKRDCDMFLYDIGDRYLVTINSIEAAEIFSASTSAREATVQDTNALHVTLEAFHSKLRDRGHPVNDLSLALDAGYDESFWDEVGSRCLSCSACAVVCPTCQCFDIVDESSLDGTFGERVRIWEGCTSPSFSVVTGGHDFRPTPDDRIKNRYYHKFLGYPARYGAVMCVGCGRCERACKADISPRVILAEMGAISAVGNGK